MSSEAGSLEIQFQDQEQAILLESVSDPSDRRFTWKRVGRFLETAFILFLKILCWLTKTLAKAAFYLAIFALAIFTFGLLSAAFSSESRRN